ncbi:hypothetical protein PpBr36_06942 [Pyricularia pennisetigena]|uniref:hypothetical protein n=1 Tax=Pyricularia pennisetigena TaxID=1578925 RepID=UPI0011513813|nr:hypothetical protein PpBr36_06942 [Pyricularia pennisetigena]TLS25864.1 hypothetical protein PpBr36_06942 [Pyricularia pennisetigena]
MEKNASVGQAGQTSGNVAERNGCMDLSETSKQDPAVQLRPRTNAEARKMLADIKYREEAVEFAKKFLPRAYVEDHIRIKRKLSKKPRLAKEYVPSYPPKPWKLPKALQQWQNSVVANEGRPSVLLLACKTEWARSFGKPAEMGPKWYPDAFADGNTHLIMNNMMWGAGGPWAEILSCKPSFVVKRRGGNGKTYTLGKPVVVTCNRDNDPRKNPRVAALFKAEHVVAVDLRRKFF